MARIDFKDAALFIDFDGTLVDFQATPDAVSLPRTTLALIESLANRMDTAVAIVSGRDIDSLQRMVGAQTVKLAGAHGAQIADPDGTVTDLLSDQAGLADARRALATFADRHGLLLEHKTTGIALHFRLQPAMEREARAFAASLAAGNAALRVIQGNMVSEVTLAAIDKGKAARALMSGPPFAGRIPIAMGDDTTDEDLFVAVQDLGGAGIKVGPGPTHARYGVPNVAGVTGWLTRCLNEGCFRFEDLLVWN